MLAEAKVVVHAWLRSGNTASARGVKAFLAETLARLPADFRLYALRADSGFFVTEFLVELERRALPYAIAVRMNPHLRRTVAGIKQWTPFARGLEAAETSYQAYGWQAPRRLVVVRETIRERPEARGRKLLEVPGYTTYSASIGVSKDQWDVNVYGENLANSHAAVFESTQEFILADTPLRPRVIGARIDYRF